MPRMYFGGPKSYSSTPPCYWMKSNYQNGMVFDYTSSRTSISSLAQLASTITIVTQATKGSQPTWGSNFQNGYPALTFDGAANRMFMTTTSICQNVPGFTMFAVARRSIADVSTTNQYLWMTSTNPGVSSTNERAYIGWMGTDQLTIGGYKADTDSALQGCSTVTSMQRGQTYVLAGKLDYANNLAKTFINGVCDTYQDPTTKQAASGDPVTQGSVNGVGFQTATAGSANTNTTGNGVSLGGKSGGSAFFNGDIFEIICYPFAMTDAQIQTESARLANQYAVPYRSTYTTWLIFDGSSSTFGFGLFGQNKLPTQILSLAGSPSNVGFINDGISSSVLSTQISDAAGSDGIDNREIPPSVRTGKRILICGLGSNDIVNGDSALTALANLRTYIKARKASGKYDKIVLWLPQVRSDTTTATNILAYNALVKANLATLMSDGLDALVDTTQITHLSVDGDYNNTTYYQNDKIHLTAAGMALLAAAVYAVIKSWL